MKRFGFSQWSGFFIGLLGLAVVVSWNNGQLAWMHCCFHAVPMAFNTALGFIVIGIALFMQPGRIKYARFIRGGAGIFLLLLSLATLFKHILSISVDDLFFLSAEHPGIYPNIMASNTAAAFLLSSLIFLFTQRQSSKRQSILVQILSFAILLIASATVAGYILHIDMLYAWYHAKMAIPTAIALVGLSLSFLFECCQSQGFQDLYEGREDVKISYLGGAILIFVSLSSGLAVFGIFEHQFKHIFQETLEMSLRNRVQILEEDLDEARAKETIAATRLFALRLIRQIDTTTQTHKALADLNTIARNLLPIGIDGVTYFDTRGRVLAQAGRFVENPAMALKLHDSQASSYIYWIDGHWLFNSRRPLMDHGRLLGWMNVQIHLRSVDKMMQDRHGLGRSGETVVCGVIAPQRMRCFPHRLLPIVETHPFIIKNNPLPMSHALNGKHGTITAPDFRNKMVIATYAPIAKSGMGMVLKMDTEELYQPIRDRIRLLLPFFFILIVGGMLLLRWQVVPLLRRLIESKQQAVDMSLRLRESEARHRAVVETAHEGIITADSQGKIVYLNQAAMDLFGYSAKEALGQPLTIIIPERFRQAHQAGLARYIETQKKQIMDTTLERTGLRKNGEEFPLEISIASWESNNGLHFTGIMRDITERKKVDQMKNEFVSTVSHELRTPLTSIRGSLGLLLHGVGVDLPPAAVPLLEIAHGNCERLARLINDMLDIEKIESGKMDFQRQEMDLAALAQQALQSYQGYAAAYQVRFVLETPLPTATVYADPDRLMQVFANLLSNAAKFSPPQSEVRVGMSRRGTWIRVAVSDRGAGVPAEFRTRIFQKFAQADASDTRQQGGTGLGLSISRAIIEQLGGRIDFESDARGSTFYFELPLLEMPATTPCPAVCGQRSPGPQILICEDDPDIARLLGILLEQACFRPQIVHNAADAKKRLMQHHAYAAMTLDLTLPDQDGITLLHELRQHEATRKLPIIIVSAQPEQRCDAIHGDALHIADWLCKPIDENRLIDAVRLVADPGMTSLPHILHIEDDPDIRHILSAMLKDRAHVDYAGNLSEARYKLQMNRFDLAIVDLSLPDGMGTELLPLLNASTPPVPVLVFSAREMNHEVAGKVTAQLVKSRTSNEELLHRIIGIVEAPLARASNNA